MLPQILTAEQGRILADERQSLAGLEKALARFEAAAEDQTSLENSIRQLDELFLIVVVGEFNSGKSAFLNALLGEKLLEEGVTPTTAAIHLIKHGASLERETTGSFQVLKAPIDLLREVNFVDTPGTNAILREHETITTEFIPRSDIVLFITSADRPFTESERSFMERIRIWGKKIVIVVNKIDILEPPEIESVCRYIAENVQKLLGFPPEIFAISAREALRGKLGSNGHQLMRENRFADLEQYIISTLDQQERIRLKMLNPVGVGLRLIEKYLGVIANRLTLLQDDLVAVRDVDAQLALYEEDMTREFRFRLSDVENVLHEFEKRGNQFFDETVRLSRVFELTNKSRIKSEFERKVVADVPRLIERRVDEIIDWMVSRELRQWQAVVERLRQRQVEHTDRMVGQVGDGFEYHRNRLLETVGSATQRAVLSYDRDSESSRLAREVQMAVAGTALAEAGAVGLGTIVTLLATSTAADVTGILAASVLAVLGLFVIPSKRQEAKKQLRRKIAAMHEDLMTSLTGQFESEIQRSRRRIEEAISPYTRFVRGEKARYESFREELGQMGEQLRGLKARIGSL